MPQLRQDVVTGRWVAIATERAKRPSSFTRAAAVAVPAGAQCPFCVGNEAMTPPEVLAYRPDGSQPNTPGWEVRVVPNLFPAFGPPDGELTPGTNGPYSTMNGVGAHEVIVNSPSHENDLAQMTVGEIAKVIRTWIDRYQTHSANRSIQYVLIINNHGKEAGASLEHPHTQLFGVPVIPLAIQEDLDGTRRYEEQHGRCVYCDIIAYECRSGDRVVYENEHFLVFAPFASRTPFETQIIPKRHEVNFADMTAAEQVAFADALHQLTGRIGNGLNNPPFNFYIHSAPCHLAKGTTYHWHVELLPKLAIAAGFELGSGIMINVATPEAAAEFLRGVDVHQPPESTVAPALH